MKIRFKTARTGIIAAIAISGSFLSTAEAQQNRELLRGNMIPGQASQIRMLANPANVGKIQAVKVIAPEGVELSVASNGAFVSTMKPECSAGMQLGSLYRFRIEGVDVGTPFELYPSIELLDFLHPPKGLETDFPIPIVITESDIREASSGRLVTKVVYLEDPETALPRFGPKEIQPWIDVSASEDPVRTAVGLGRPMAIMRIGSRVPTAQELSQASISMNAFNSATPADTIETVQPELRMNSKYQNLPVPLSNSKPSIPKADARTNGRN